MDQAQQGVEEQPIAQEAQPVQEEVTQSEAPTETEQQPEIADDELPDDAEKQREAFIKLRQENKRLKELQMQDQDVSQDLELINQFRQGVYQQPTEQITSETDVESLNASFQNVARTAQEAIARSTRLEQELEDQKLFAEFPELNPKSEKANTPTARAFEELVAGKAALEILNGRKPNVIEIARKAKEAFSGLSNAQRDEVSKEVTQSIQAKEHATLEATGSSFMAPKADDTSELQARMNRGDMDAVAQLMKIRGM
jgi:hypothetical protein